MKNILDIQVSAFKNVRSKEPQTVYLYDWLVSNEHKTLVETIRNTDDEAKRKSLKENLPAITPSGLFKVRGADQLVSHSGFICIDIDKKPNADLENFPDLKTLIQALDCVAFCAQSVSGDGFYVLIPICNPEKHKEHFKHLQVAFAACGIEIDASCRDVGRLRFASYDEHPYINLEAKKYCGILEDNPLSVNDINSQKGITQKRVEQLIDKIELLDIDITEEYKSWFAIGCSIAKEFGEAGRSYFHRISRIYQGYTTKETDRQYSACLTDKNQHSINTLFWYAQKHNIYVDATRYEFATPIN
ncbi:MAG: PriCT-2 domain-containing protein [Prevotellaceae bacterium]|jgi:hypothetical protein|nr:PriCT-2 domain-containing protein [Prevotellaceae bacterium]